MKNKRIFTQLTRIRKFELEEKQKDLALVRAHRAMVLRRMEELDLEMANQVQTVRQDHQLMRYFQGYRELYKSKRNALENELQAADAAVARAEDALRVAFSEKKKVEIIADRRRVEYAYDLNRQDQIRSDELFLARITND